MCVERHIFHMDFSWKQTLGPIVSFVPCPKHSLVVDLVSKESVKKNLF